MFRSLLSTVFSRPSLVLECTVRCKGNTKWHPQPIHEHSRHRTRPPTKGIHRKTKMKVVDNSAIGKEAMVSSRPPYCMWVYKPIRMYHKRHMAKADTGDKLFLCKMAIPPGMLRHLPIFTGLIQLVCSLISTPLVAWLCFNGRWWIKDYSTATQCISLYDSTVFRLHHYYYDYQALVLGQVLGNNVLEIELKIEIDLSPNENQPKLVMFFGIWVMVSSMGGMLLHIVQHVMHINKPQINFMVMVALGAVIVFAVGAVGVETYYTTNAFWIHEINMHRYRAAAAFLWFSLMAQLVEFVWRVLQLSREHDVVESDMHIFI